MASVFRELVSIPHLFAHPNFSLAVLLIQEEEVRCHDAGHNWRRKGWGTVERRLIGVVEERIFETPADLAALLPTALAEPFTARQLAAALDQPVWLAHKMIYCLAAMGELAPAGKTGPVYDIRAGYGSELNTLLRDADSQPAVSSTRRWITWQ